MDIRNIPAEDIPQVLIIYQESVEKGTSTFTRTVPTVEEWNKGHHPFARTGVYEGDLLIGWAALSPTSSKPQDRKSTRLNSSHTDSSRMPSSA